MMPLIDIGANGITTMLKYFGLLVFLTILITLTEQRIVMGENNTKFEWAATESAPEGYPMEIIRGTFIYHGEDKKGLYIPSGGTLNAGWGEPISSHGVGDKYKPLPDKLEIIFFSYADKQYYHGKFDLPYEKILKLFRDGVENATVFPNGVAIPNHNRIMAGIAPGGVVSVWVTGRVTKEVFFGKAEKVDLDPSKAFDLPFQNKEQSDKYIEDGLLEAISTEQLESIRKNGIPFDLWGRYRNRYDWIPVFANGHQPEKVNLVYLNGENNNNWYLEGDLWSVGSHPAPRKMSFKAKFEKKVVFTIFFDEMETMAAFEKLGKNGQKVHLEFEPRLPRTNVKIRLYNDEESIQLTRFKSKK